MSAARSRRPRRSARARRSQRVRRAWLWGSLGALCLGAVIALAVAAISLANAYQALSQPIPSDEPIEARAAQQADEPAAASLDPDAADEIAGDAAGSSSVAVSTLADPAWVAETSERLSIPERALAAYAGAALIAAQEHPGCSLAWNTLAGIGSVESLHGTIYGSSIGEDGVAEPAIIGIALDGNGVQHVADTDEGRLDGDTEFDRAVGPMQFIPETWGIYGRDGSGDGAADPQNIDDAALTAADYLCRAGDLSDPDTWIAAISSYNPTVEYNNKVATVADRYAQ